MKVDRIKADSEFGGKAKTRRRIMKSLRTVVLFLLLPLLMAMGSLKGDVPPDRIPVPAKKFTAIFIDQTDLSTECTEVSIEGGVYLDGKRGEGLYTISFDQIETIFFRFSSGKLYATTTLRDGGKMELVVNKDHRAYGKTKYGTFQIKLMDLKKVILGAGQSKS